MYRRITNNSFLFCKFKENLEHGHYHHGFPGFYKIKIQLIPDVGK